MGAIRAIEMTFAIIFYYLLGSLDDDVFNSHTHYDFTVDSSGQPRESAVESSRESPDCRSPGESPLGSKARGEESEETAGLE